VYVEERGRKVCVREKGNERKRWDRVCVRGIEGKREGEGDIKREKE